MSNEEKILEMLVAMDARQSKTEELLVAMQGEIHSMQGQIGSIQGDIRQINGKLDSMDSRLNALEQKMDDLTESHEETRSGVNALLEWSDKVSSIQTLHIPKI